MDLGAADVVDVEEGFDRESVDAAVLEDVDVAGRGSTTKVESM